MNLTKYFDQWFYGKGYPKLNGELQFDLATKKATVKLSQTQMDEMRGVGLFDLAVKVRVTDSKGQAYEDVIKMIDQVSGSVDFTLSGGVMMVEIDPEDDWLLELTFHPGQDILQNVLKSSSNPTKRIWAAQGLIRIGSQSAYAFLLDAMRTESFYGVHEEIAKTLAPSTSLTARHLIIEMAGFVKDPRALWEVAVAMRVEYAPYREVLLKLLKLPHLGYGARAAVLEAIGAQRVPSDLDVLTRAVVYHNSNGYWPFVTNGALRGLGLHRSQEAFTSLMAFIKPGALRDQARGVAALALANSSLWVSATDKLRAREELVQLLSEPEKSVTKNAVIGLGVMEARPAIPALQDYKSRISNQDQPFLDRVIDKLRQVRDSGDTTAVGALKQTIEGLEARVRELERLRAVTM